VYHVDLYRIASATELEFLGWSELREGLVMVEWPERVPSLADDADLQLQLHYDGSGRCLEISAISRRAAPWLDALRLP
jgi:tRNA threonylcarbamoyladenosine biosynthesis protein TsaE